MIAARNAPRSILCPLIVQPSPFAPDAAAGRVDQWGDDIVGEGLDECAEAESNNEADGNDDEVTLHQEVLETLEHPSPLLVVLHWEPVGPTGAGRKKP